MVIATLRLVPSAKQRSDMLELLRSAVDPAESQPGCMSCHIYEEDGSHQATIMQKLGIPNRRQWNVATG